MLSNGLAVANGKGGVGKTSLVANVSAIAAASGWQVLAVDVDVQGNLGMDLGYAQRDAGDQGAGLLEALATGSVVQPSLRGVRPNLDVISAGRKTRELEAIVGERLRRDRAAADHLGAALRPIAHEYDLIIFDSPPSGASNLADLALAAARSLVVPVKADEGSLEGLDLTGARVREARQSVNPELEMLGVVLFDFGMNETAIRSEVTGTLDQAFGGKIHVFEPAIRRSTRAARDMRRDGVVAIEYEELAEEDKQRRLAALRRGAESLRRLGPARSAAAAGLADDYMAVSEAILSRFGREPAMVGSGQLTPDPWA